MRKRLKEIWKTIPKFTKYEISTLGRVRHKKLRRILKGSLPANGYAQVNVYNDVLHHGITKCIHHLVSLTFMKKKPYGAELHFIDRDKTHIYLNNLEYRFPSNNRPRKYPLRYCEICGNVLIGNRKYTCSLACRYFYSHTLVTCDYCGNTFYRENGIINQRSVDRNYNGKMYCNTKCAGRAKTRDAKR